ncbi:succinylglutamate-semialdehyde dehydrogenase [Candidatus Laterigemmans baculatus]|uniref:succinylglutamate-semialdehyde dehydrogenase n=1 Tax=Candidatus Laterigemmans baculatus TaxID=2770505 RepID=UPI0013DA53F9|nr:succinylglutamate-semialdehyde dehydrogenase [Candidatus Laterigemmans baculatus]
MSESGDLIIDGESIRGAGGRLESHNPADGSLVWSGHAADAAQTTRAVAAAAAAWESWAERPVEQRVEVVRSFGEQLESAADALAELISREVGKPRWEARAEVATSRAKVELTIRALRERRAEQAKELAGGRAELRFRPLGVVLVLGPFNFPAHLPGGQIIPAILSGNAVVFKPSELTPAVGLRIVELWQRAGLPPGILNLLQGGPDVAQTVIGDPRIGGVMFTGSRRAGVAIHQQLASRPEVLLALEMGGNSPLVVASPNDPRAASGMIVASAFVTAGQRCTCARRLIVVDDAEGQAVVERLVERIARLRVGLPQDDPEPYIGPLISARAAEKMLDAQQQLIAAGGVPLVEMQRSSRCPALLSPGLVDVTSISGEREEEELFGPLLQLEWAADFPAAVALASATRFGLAAALIGGSAEQFERFRRRVPAGVVNWNRQTTGASGALPFGGIGHSGNHRPAGFWAIDACSDAVASVVSETVNDDEFDRSQL